MRVVVTGGAQGIGKAIVNEFLKHGHDVISLDIAYEHGVFGEAVAEGGSVTRAAVDVSDPKQLPDISYVDILINNAGLWDKDETTMGVNFYGTKNCTEKYGLQSNIKAIVNIASVSAHNGAEFPTYAASKGAVLAYTKWTALEVAKWGATCNSISPGGVTTTSNGHILESSYLYRKVLEETTLGRWASSEEIAQWVYFVSVINKSMTGQDIIIDNGETTKANFIW